MTGFSLRMFSTDESFLLKTFNIICSYNYNQSLLTVVNSSSSAMFHSNVTKFTPLFEFFFHVPDKTTRAIFP